MARKLAFVCLLLTVQYAFAQHQHATAGAKSAPSATALLPGMGNAHHAVSTTNPLAQKYFDEGLSLIYAFNHAEAEKAFAKAAELDPNLAMAQWGIALAVGPNYNVAVDEPREIQAYGAIQEALKMKAPPQERAYIEALSKRYIGDPHGKDLKPLDLAYRDAMRELSAEYPDDLDAATLFAESGMNVNPWKLHHPDGTPAEGTPEIIATLESVLRRDPNHMGAIHYYIHAVEASPNPERAPAGASRLTSLAPAAGHLVHMQGHVYIRTGDFDAAVKTNELAAAADRAYMQANGGEGIYPAMYYSHNLHFIAACASMDGDYLRAHKAAEMLAAHVGPHVKAMPPLEGFMTIPASVEMRFGKWEQVLKMPQPDPAMKGTTVFWHFARGMALAGSGKPAEAETELKVLFEAEKQTPEDVIFNAPINNKLKDILKIAGDVLGAKIAVARHDHAAAVPLLRRAVAIQDTLKYGEPPDWFYPVRESLGAVLLLNGNAAEAEKVFREDLDLNPRNPRSLFGLREALKAQDRAYDAEFVNKQFQSSWKSTEKLRVEDLA